MASVNKVILVGNVGADVETRYMPNGDAVANVRLATTESWKDKNSGEKREVTEWHRLVAYRKLAEIFSQYVKKGSQLYIEGRIKTRKWQDKDGQERYTTEVEATEMKMLGRREGQGEPVSRDDPFAPAAAAGGNANRRPPANVADLDDDIPF